MPHTSNNKDLNNSLDKVMGSTYFTFKGVLCEKMIGGYKVLNQRFTKWSDAEEEIDRTLNVISNSLK